MNGIIVPILNGINLKSHDLQYQVRLMTIYDGSHDRLAYREKEKLIFLVAFVYIKLNIYFCYFYNFYREAVNCGTKILD